MKAKRFANIVLLFGAILICTISALWCFSSNISSDQIHYAGQTDYVAVDFIRYTDYNEFIEAKCPSIMTADSPEVEKGDNSAFLAGNFYISGRQYQGENCQVFLFRKSQRNYQGIPHPYEGYGESDADTDVWTVPFIAYELDDQQGNIYDKATIILDEKLIGTVPLNVVEVAE